MNESGARKKTISGREAMNAFGHERTPFLFVLDFDVQKPIVRHLSEIEPRSLRFDIQGFANVAPMRVASTPRVELEKTPISISGYEAAFQKVIAELLYGNSFLLNLTFSTPVRINLSLEEIFTYSEARYKLYMQDRFVVFSPETFVQIRNGKISSFPMKGTIDAAIPDAERKILENPKETAEHTTIVDLIRNDLSMVARDVHVDRFRYVEAVRTNQKTLLQVSSGISGQLPDDYHSRLGDIIYTLLPAGSISGAPKKKTVEIIKNIEPHDRGYFTGVFGYYNGEDLDCGVMIRFIEKQGDRFIFRSGGGITAQSVLEEEYQEMLDKVYVPIPGS